jgi:2-dehydro-3-deoxygluconokinase
MKRVVALGELLLRLRAPTGERLLQSARLEASYGGAEFNVLASLVRFNVTTDYVSALPQGGLGPTALALIRQHGVGARYIEYAAGRLGLYFLEAGNGVRPARVVYDRAGTVFADIDARRFDWSAILSGADLLHLSGITPAVSESAAQLAHAAAEAAAALKVPVSFDLNMRSQLWQASGRDPFASLVPLLRRAAVVFATCDDAAFCLPQPRRAACRSGDFAPFAAALFAEYPALEVLIASTRRGSSAADFELGAEAQRRGGPVLRGKEFAVRGALEVVGGGDALVAGCLYGMLVGWPDQRWLDFGLAARALKHTIGGDINLAALDEIEALLAGATPVRTLR